MSMDTYTYVDKKTFEVWDCTASCVCNHKKHCFKCQKQSCLGKGKNLDEAIDMASENEDEYGICVSLWCK